METLVIVRESNYWGSGKDEAEAKANYRKACSSRHPASTAAVVTEYRGTEKALREILIDDFDGTITYPKSVKKIR